ncbi:MAG: glutamine--fructose-6-phosphate transaminase (isomerizing) [Thermomicrobiales bacterium]|nr:glutamine--fructose-6-phosphate transaminase (isomerizing) [Thermomicrobiales bacterium]
MCGVFGYVGPRREIGPAILGALKALEYRGYDSWGVAVPADGTIAVQKETGKIGGASVNLPPATRGFGHTRWATHGGVTVENAHPHLDCGGRVAIIHNGIIENFRPLRAELEARGHQFRSDTDSEVVAHLIEEFLDEGCTLLHATRNAFQRLHGLNAVIAMSVDGDELIATKSMSPLVVGIGSDGSATIASDAMALQGFASDLHYLEDDEIAWIGAGEIAVYERDSLRPRSVSLVPLPLEERDLSLNGHQHYMSKEMAEQPDVLDRLATQSEPMIRELARAIEDSYGTFLTGCGTASYAALTGSYLFSRIAAWHVNFVVGSEFKYHEHFLRDRSFVLALSQSGETADILEAMRAARQHGSRLGALVNTRNSTLDRMADLSVHLDAGPEQCVLSTKAYTAKVSVLLMTAYALAGRAMEGQLLVSRAATAMREMLAPAWVDRVRATAEAIRDANHLFVIGRGLSYPTALEAALKIKEVSYVHAEGFAGGELKHGVIALITEGTPCVVYAPNDETRADIISGAMELRSRGGFMIGIGSENDPVFDIFLETPDVGDASPLVQALPAQMLGYHLALLRGYDPDKPRNLAKSVTVK